MTKNIIFDFGNVLVQWHPELIYKDYFGDEAKAWWFLRHVIDLDWRNRIDAGESMEACIDEQQTKFPEFREPIALFNDRWEEMLTGEVTGMREVIQQLKDKGYEIFGLTNWSMETFPKARKKFGILQMIDRYVVSGAERCVKPDPQLFRILLERYNLKAEECTFVDDNPANVAAAQKLGMLGIVFTDANELTKQLGI